MQVFIMNTCVMVKREDSWLIFSSVQAFGGILRYSACTHMQI